MLFCCRVKVYSSTTQNSPPKIFSQTLFGLFKTRCTVCVQLRRSKTLCHAFASNRSTIFARHAPRNISGNTNPADLTSARDIGRNVQSGVSFEDADTVDRLSYFFGHFFRSGHGLACEYVGDQSRSWLLLLTLNGTAASDWMSERAYLAFAMQINAQIDVLPARANRLANESIYIVGNTYATVAYARRQGSCCPTGVARKEPEVPGTPLCMRLCFTKGWNTCTLTRHNSTINTHPFNGPLSGTTQVGRYQKGKTNLDFTEARGVSGSGISWAICMQVCTLLQTNNHASTPPLSFLQAGCPSCRPTNSVKAMKADNSTIRRQFM